MSLVSLASEKVLSIEDANVEFNGRVVLRDCSFEVGAGENVVIVGSSGSGKSTLLDLIAEDHDSLSKTVRSAMVLQEGALLEHLNVIENLELVTRYTGQNSPRLLDSTKTTDLLSQLNIDEALHTARVCDLSGGQKRRVAIARALISSPELMLFDEPDAGLDIGNLANLADTVSALSNEQGKTCVTVSHNPFYIARIATRVYLLDSGKLRLLADWPDLAVSESQKSARQLELQELLINQDVSQWYPKSSVPKINQQPESPFTTLISQSLVVIRSLFHKPVSIMDQFNIAVYGSFLSVFSGLFFFILVGVMLGCTTLAVVRTLADSALTGFVGWFIDPADLVSMMRGRFALYLAPAVGGMLFVARSGTMISNWIGEMVRTQQIRALDLLYVPTKQYLVAPTVVSLFFSMTVILLVFCVSVWLGGVIAAQHLFDMGNAYGTMLITWEDISHSKFWMKTVLYSGLVSIIVSALAFAPKKSAHQVNIHTTKGIIYSTLSIAMGEMLLILL